MSGKTTGSKTRQQQRQIIEKRVDTSNEDKDFDPRPYLEASEHPRQQVAEERRPLRQEDGDPAPRGENQESQHHKNSGTPEDQGKE